MLVSLRTPDGGSFGAWPGEMRPARRESARREPPPRAEAKPRRRRAMAERAPAPLWDNPLLMLWLANLLFATGALLLLYAGFYLAVHLAVFPLREVRVSGDLRNVTRDHVEAAAKRHLTGNFFTLDLQAMRAALEATPWVRRVSLRRVWPDRLEVAIDEHRAVARWKDEALVNDHGELFAGETTQRLPVLDGPAGRATEVAAAYTRFADVLAPTGHQPKRVLLTARGAWQVTLDDGMTLRLGREQVQRRLERFVAAYPIAVATIGARVRSVDLRYPNGFAIQAAPAGDGQEAGA
jgi:cell division protein FtsQ